MKKMRKIFYVLLAVILFIIPVEKVSAVSYFTNGHLFDTEYSFFGNEVLPIGPYWSSYDHLPIKPKTSGKFTTSEWQRFMQDLGDSIIIHLGETPKNMFIARVSDYTQDGEVYIVRYTVNEYAPYIDIVLNTLNGRDRTTFRFSNNAPFRRFYINVPSELVDPDGVKRYIIFPSDDIRDWTQETDTTWGHLMWTKSGSNIYPDPTKNNIVASNTSFKYNGEFVARFMSEYGEFFDGEEGDPFGNAPTPPTPPQLPDDNNWWNWLNPTYWIGRLWNSIMSPLWDLLQWGFETITDFVVVPVINGLKVLFIPSENTLTNLYNNTIGKLREKVPIFDFAFGTLTAITGFTALETYPEDYNPFPALSIPFWGINNQQVIDLTWFRTYRPMIMDWITYIAWFFFLKKLIQTIPLMFEK